MNGQTREMLKRAIDQRVRERAITRNVCPQCLEDLPEHRHALSIYCSRLCANNASDDRRRGRVAA